MSLASRFAAATVVAAAVSGIALGQPGGPTGYLPSEPLASGGVAWREDFEAAKAEAKQTGRLVLLHFATPECGPCRALDSNVFNQPTVANALQSRFVPVKVNANEEVALAQAYGIQQVPTDVVVTAEGQTVDRMISPASPMAYVSRLMDAATKSASTPGKAFQLAAAQSPYGQRVNKAYANLSIPQPATTTPPQGVTNATSAASSPNQSAFGSRYGSLGDRYSQAAAPAIDPKASAGKAFGVGASLATPKAPPAITSSVNPQIPPTKPANQVIGNPYAALGVQPPKQAAPTAPNAVLNAKNTHSVQPPAQPPTKPGATVAGKTPQLPPGSPPLGFDGCCPVTMKNQRRWIKGNPQWGAVHRGRTYLFASQTQRDEFMKRPDGYSPVLSGVDPVLAVERGQSVPGKREFGLEYLDAIYLFSSEESLNRFWSNPTRYASGVKQAMSGGVPTTR